MRSTASPLPVIMIIGVFFGDSQIARDLEAVLAAELQVERDEIDRQALDQRHRLTAIGRFDHRKALALETRAQQRAHLRLVVDDENSLLIRGHAGSLGPKAPVSVTCCHTTAQSGHTPRAAPRYFDRYF